jgi:hypothetical protein
MKRPLSLVLLILGALFLSGCGQKKLKAALQITTAPTATIFINGKLVGKTPYTDREMTPGEISLKLIPESETASLVTWEGKLKLVGGVLSVVNREFTETEETSAGDILTLESTKDSKSASLMVVTSPDGAMVKLDEENRGFSPLFLDKVSEGDHKITLTLNGYKERVTQARTVNGYKLILNSKLAQESGESSVATPTPTLLTPVPTSKTKASPTPKATGTPKVTGPPQATVTPKATSAAKEISVVIKGTPEGWLRVRSEPSTSSKELARVNEGDKFTVLEEKSGWYKITYEPGKEGWISARYTQKTAE